jgi:NitT/TauT family transport system substrate-binding protein
VQWYNANLRDPDLVRIISGFTRMQPELVAKLDLQRLPEVVNLGSVATTVKLMKDNGMITGDIDLAAMTDPSALK